MAAPTIAAVVLAGGQSSRMGQDKAWLRFGPETLLERLVRIVGSAIPEVILAAGAEQPLPPSLGHLPVRRDEEPGRGPLPALVASLAGLEAELVFLAACDMPLLRACLIPALVERCDGWDAAVPVIDARQMATCAVYRTAALQARAAAYGDPRDGSLRSFIAALRLHELNPELLRGCDPDLVSFTPCNTPEEYARALALAGVGGNGGVRPPYDRA